MLSSYSASTVFSPRFYQVVFSPAMLSLALSSLCGAVPLTAEMAGRHPRRQQQNCRSIFLFKMELQTLFQRESIADPFLIRIMQITPSSVPIFIVAYPLFHTRIQTWRAGKPRFQRNCRFKMAVCWRRENIGKRN